MDLSVMIIGALGGLASYLFATRVLLRNERDCGVTCSCCPRAFSAVKR